MEKKDGMTNEVKLQRMLLHFESQLPEHEVGEWLLEVRPHREIVLDETNVMRMGGNDKSNYGLLTGRGTCNRCRRQFTFEEGWGNYCVYPESEQERLAASYPTLTTAYKLEEMKVLVQKEAERSGKCWGGIPQIPTKSYGLPTFD